ncbi:MAG: methionine synthase [Armatimonadetes bacterium]|nr:methionine synthase [Armatimonadota bacterium]
MSDKTQELRNELSRRILVLDGAMGTSLEHMRPSAADFGGEELEGCNEALNINAPQFVQAVHRSFLDAGCDVLETNSFNGSAIVLAEYGLQDRVIEINRRAAELACEAAESISDKRRVFVAGAIGPTNKAITVTGGTTFDALVETFREQATGLILGGVDYILLETQQDTVNVKAALIGVQQAMKDTGRPLPIAVSATIEMNGTMLAGQNVEALYYTLAGQDLLYLGLNCATGPDLMTDHIRTLSQISHFPVSCVPNAGLPNTDGEYDQTADDFRSAFKRFASEGFVNVVGGCCGTTPAHIQALAEVAAEFPPRKPQPQAQRAALAGAEPLLLDDITRPLFVGERTNVIGSRKFRRLISEGKFEAAAEIGKEQVQKGAHIVDLCTADPDRNEQDDLLVILQSLLRKVRVPVMIDSTDGEVIHAALKRIGGKPVINSINLEDGEKRFEQICPLARRYGAALVVGLIDEDKQAGMAVTVERKLEIAERSYRLLTEKYDIAPGEIIFDPLVFPAGTGDPNYKGAAEATIKGVRAIKERFPDVFTVLGISNVSFGLPAAGREVLNSVFLYENTQAGLDMAIVNTAGIRRYAQLSEDEIRLSMDLLYERTEDPIAAFAEFFREARETAREDELAHMSAEERISRCVLDGTRDGLEGFLDEALTRATPLEIINGPLMAGMDEVGRLFGDNKLIVAEVLESAEAMKAAVDYLKQFLDSAESSATKGKMLLATVKGDVHDIGKNLVDMILSNNGYEIVNLGIKVPPETLIEAVHQHKPDIIGLSGLLVRSAQQMVVTAQDFTAAGVDVPLIVGGAALTKKFTMTRISDAYGAPTFYAGEAMEGLQYANRLVDEAERPKLLETLAKERAAVTETAPPPPPEPVAIERPEWNAVEIPQPPDMEEHVLHGIPIEEVTPLLNRIMVFGKHLGLKTPIRRLEDETDVKAQELKDHVDRVIQEAHTRGMLRPRAVWRWLPAESEGDIIRLRDPDSGDTLVEWTFPRRSKEPFTCAADWIKPASMGGGDYLGLFVTTAGPNPAVEAAKWREEGRLLDSHILSCVGIETAEATAEWIHQKMRADWGFPDPAFFGYQELFKTRYRGIRLSFGYPASPELAYQRDLFSILRPYAKIGVALTDGDMMEPESSVSALVFHHPDGHYFVT